VYQKECGLACSAEVDQSYNRAPKGTIIVRQDQPKQTHRARTQAANSARWRQSLLYTSRMMYGILKTKHSGDGQIRASREFAVLCFICCSKYLPRQIPYALPEDGIEARSTSNLESCTGHSIMTLTR
jgi:hypothetical protein